MKEVIITKTTEIKLVIDEKTITLTGYLDSEKNNSKIELDEGSFSQILSHIFTEIAADKLKWDGNIREIGKIISHHDKTAITHKRQK